MKSNSKLRLEGLKRVFSSFIPSLSLLSFTTTHLTFKRVHNLFCCIVVWRQRIFELSCWRISRWAVCSVSAWFNWDFNFSWTQLRKLRDTKMHRWPQQIYSAHLEMVFMWMQIFDEWEQCSQTIEDIRSNWKNDFSKCNTVFRFLMHFGKMNHSVQMIYTLT